MPHRIAQPDVRRWYADMLLRRDEPGDREKAQAFLVEALAMYDRIGMPLVQSIYKETGFNPTAL